MYRAVSGVSAAQVRTRARTKVSKVAFRLVDPLPAQVLSEVDVKRTHAAVLLQVPETQHWRTVNLEKGLICACMMQLPEGKGQYQQYLVGHGAGLLWERRSGRGRQASCLALPTRLQETLPLAPGAAPPCCPAPGAGKGPLQLSQKLTVTAELASVPFLEATRSSQLSSAPHMAPAAPR